MIKVESSPWGGAEGCFARQAQAAPYAVYSTSSSSSSLAPIVSSASDRFKKVAPHTARAPRIRQMAVISRSMSAPLTLPCPSTRVGEIKYSPHSLKPSGS